ncbi:MAG: hypothetical protein GF333_06420 [Candidatus Omnitrophica bacterium]|nr:hypothetical protein [Candidatus Omnitrophota bacterium]
MKKPRKKASSQKKTTQSGRTNRKKTSGKKRTSASRKKNPFTKKELNEFRELLLNIKEDTLTRIREASENSLMKSPKEMAGDMSGYSLHMADVASDNYERDFNLGLVSTERELLMQIDNALTRIEEGRYGICEISGKPIKKTRLRAVPFARYTREVQEQLEREGKI